MTEGKDSFEDLLREVARAPEIDPRALADEDLVGRTLGHFLVVARLGKGGMGVVYRAEDVHLHRPVALKVLSANLSEEASRTALLAEARAAAAVRDPSIAAVYEVGESDGVAFIALEYVEGVTLRARLAGARPGGGEAVAIAIAIARGLSRAHAAGVVHRDLKPDNVMTGPGGATKILDFGLAGALGAAHVDGTVRGTPAYMSPEQAAGGEAGPRSDVFSFGVLAHELLSGARPFDPNAAPDARWTRTPARSTRTWPRAWSRTPRTPGAPPAVSRLASRAVARVVARCLAIDPAARYADGTALLAALEEAVAGDARRRRALRLGGVAAVGLLAAFGASRLRARPAVVVPTIALKRVTANVPESPILHAALSPDGAALAYTDPTGLSVQRIGTASARHVDVPGEGGARASLVDWFPGGDTLAVVASDPGGTSVLWRIPLGAGAPERLGEGTYSGIRVSPDGKRIAYAENDRVSVVEAVAGAKPRALARKEGGCFISELSWAPRGGRVAYASLCFDSLSSTAIESVDLEGHAPVVAVADPRLFNDSAHAGVLWTPGGEIVYPLAEWLPAESGSNLYRVAVDAVTGVPHGAPRALTSWVGTSASVLSASASGKRVAFVRFELQADVFVGDLSERNARLSRPRRLTLTDRNERPSAWSRDGKSVFFFSDRSGNFDVFQQDIAGGPARAVVADDAWETLPQVTPAGDALLYWRFPPVRAGEAVRPDLYRVALAGGQSFRLLATNAVSHPAGVGRPQPWEMRLRCPRAAGMPCLMSEREGDALVFSEVDPVKGRGDALMRVPHPTAASSLWDVSPDGTRVAIPTANGPIGIHAVRAASPLDQVASVSLPPGCDPLVPAWSADGEGLFVSAECASEPPFRLYFVGLHGAASLLWQDPPNYLLEPEPSPDGAHLAIAVKRSDNDVWMFDMP